MKKVRHTIDVPVLIRLWMCIHGYRALTTPWGAIYYENLRAFLDPRLKKHELKHIEQMKREGILRFMVKYNYYWLRYGYKNNPYEVEARLAELDN